MVREFEFCYFGRSRDFGYQYHGNRGLCLCGQIRYVYLCPYRGWVPVLKHMEVGTRQHIGQQFFKFGHECFPCGQFPFL